LTKLSFVYIYSLHLFAILSPPLSYRTMCHWDGVFASGQWSVVSSIRAACTLGKRYVKTIGLRHPDFLLRPGVGV